MLTVPPFSESAYHFFAKQIAEAKPLPTAVTSPHIMRLFPRRAPAAVRDAKFVTEYIREPTSSFRCYNPATGRASGMTESMWLAMTLSGAAFQGGLGDHFGLSTIIDLRRFAPNEFVARGGCQNWVASIQLPVRPTVDTKVGDVARQMRTMLEERIKRGDWIGHMRSVSDRVWRPWAAPKYLPGLTLELSNIGQVNIKRPMVDCCITLGCPDWMKYQGISFPTHAIKDLDTGRTRFVGELQYNTREFAKEDGHLIAESIRYALRNIGFEMRVGQAIDQIKQFQQSIQ
jgi:hypothetical protein